MRYILINMSFRNIARETVQKPVKCDKKPNEALHSNNITISNILSYHVQNNKYAEIE